MFLLLSLCEQHPLYHPLLQATLALHTLASDELVNIPRMSTVIDNETNRAHRWEVANIAFSLASLAVTFVSIARFIAEVLTPLPLLFGCILNLVLSAAVLALDIVVYVQRADKKYSIIGLGLDVALM